MHQSALAITLSSYNRQVQAVEDVEKLFVFWTTGKNDQVNEAQAQTICNAFKTCFFKYLNGVGHVPGSAPTFVTYEEYEQRKGDRLFRAQVALQQFTDSWLLPVDSNEGRIKVVC